MLQEEQQGSKINEKGYGGMLVSQQPKKNAIQMCRHCSQAPGGFCSLRSWHGVLNVNLEMLSAKWKWQVKGPADEVG